MSTSHEPAYSEDGMPKDRYRLYHVEKASGGAALTMTAGSAVVSRDSPPAFGNLLAWQDEIVPWLARLTDECHGHGCAVMIQLTHLGRRTGWNKADWLPVLSASPVREPAHRAFPKVIEDWDIERIVADYAAAAQRMQAAGLDGLEVEAYGHLTDRFWSPATNQRDDEYGGSLDNRMRFSLQVHARHPRGGRRRISCSACAWSPTRTGSAACRAPTGVEIARRFKASGTVDFLNIIRGHIETDAALTEVIPLAGMRSAPHLDFSGEVRADVGIPVFHAARINDVATARHAIAAGKLDMVGMTRALLADPHIVRKVQGGRRSQHPPLRRRHLLPRPHLRRPRGAVHPQPGDRPRGHDAACHCRAPRGRCARWSWSAPAPPGWKRRVSQPSAAIRCTLFEATERKPADRSAGDPRAAPPRPDRHHRLAAGRNSTGWASEIRYDTYATRDEVLARGARHRRGRHRRRAAQRACWTSGNDLVVSSLGHHLRPGASRPGARWCSTTTGCIRGCRRAEALAEAGASVEIVSPERFFAPEMGGMNHALYARAFHRLGVRVTINARLLSVRREGNALVAVVGSDYGSRTEERARRSGGGGARNAAGRRVCTQDLRPHSVNLGEIDYAALLDGRAQTISRNEAGAFRLLRIGDAVASRNIHAAIYDGLRYAKDF